MTVEQGPEGAGEGANLDERRKRLVNRALQEVIIKLPTHEGSPNWHAYKRVVNIAVELAMPDTE